MNLASRIEKFRKANGMTMVELAAQIDVKPQYISQIESGKRSPSLKILQKIAGALHVTTSELLGETPEVVPADIRKLVQAAEGLNSQQIDAVISVVREMGNKYNEK